MLDKAVDLPSGPQCTYLSLVSTKIGFDIRRVKDEQNITCSQSQSAPTSLCPRLRHSPSSFFLPLRTHYGLFPPEAAIQFEPSRSWLARPTSASVGTPTLQQCETFRLYCYMQLHLGQREHRHLEADARRKVCIWEIRNMLTSSQSRF